LKHFYFSLSDKIVTFFELLHDNNVITAEAFKEWREKAAMSEKKNLALYFAKNFFAKMDEADGADKKED
jgi:hypothetical protein